MPWLLLDNLFFMVPLLLIRNFVDSFGIVGLGLYIMGRKIPLGELLLLSLQMSILFTLARLLPINTGAQTNVIILLAIVLLIWKRYGMLTSTGAVLLGTWAMVLLEWGWMELIIYTGRPHSSPWPDPSSLPLTLPVSLALALPALLLQTLARKPLFFRNIWDSFTTEDRQELRFMQSLPVAQLFAALLIVSAYSGTYLYREVPSWTIRLIPPLIYGLILIFSYTWDRWVERGYRFLPLKLLDLLVFLPAIHYALAVTGGIDSPFKLLYLPVILANALKPEKIFGIISVTVSFASLTILGVQALSAGEQWYMETDLLNLATFFLVFWFMRYFLSVEDILHGKLERRAATDELTGLFNFRFLQNYLEENNNVWNGLERYLIMFDLDNFKYINDHFGHPVGDALLRKIAVQVKKAVRDRDILVRYGGDEFVVIPESSIDRDQAQALGERIRQTVESTSAKFLSNLSQGPSPVPVIAASVGIASSAEPDIDPLNILKKADKALYEAKYGGKNRIVFYENTQAEPVPLAEPVSEK